MTRVSFILLLLSCLASVAMSQTPTQPIIDVHAHVYASDPRWAMRLANPVTGRPLTADNEAAHRMATLDAMRKYHVTSAIVSNDYAEAQRWKLDAPDRIMVSFAFDDPASVDLGFLRKEHAAGRLSAIGEIGAQYAGLSPDDPRLEPIFALAEELDIPVAIHLGLGPPGTPFTCCPKFRTTLGNPQLLEPVLIRHPKLRVNVMHSGYPYLAEMKAILYMYPRVNADIAVIDWMLPRDEFYAYLKALVQAGFGKRLMFGSDQMVWPEAIGMAVEAVKSAPFLSESQKRDIFYNNARNFYRLK